MFTHIISHYHFNRQNVQQQSIMVTQKKTTPFKRPRNSLTMTPLTRQVMTKSIHRAILEYQQHTHNGVGSASPKSPLDLRVRKNTESPSRIAKNSHKSSNSGENIIRSNSLDSNLRLSPLETVYEQDKDTGDDVEYENVISKNYDIIEVSNEHHVIANGPMSSNPIGETPVLVSRKLSVERTTNVEPFDGDIWYTPKECVQSKIVENIEVIVSETPH